MKTTKDKFLLALGVGLLVSITATVNAATVQFDQTLILKQLVGKYRCWSGRNACSPCYTAQI